MYAIENLHKRGTGVENKSQKDLEANSYVCRSYNGKTGRGRFAPLLPQILDRIKAFFQLLEARA